MKERLEQFIQEELANKISKDFIYNEFSLQHELGIYLRKNLGDDFTIKFERNIANALGMDKKKNKDKLKDFVKHEIDIVVAKGNEKYAIELKFPRNGQTPVQMYSFIKDIRFCEQMVEEDFDAAYCLTVVEDKKFYSNEFSRKTETKIYTYFRNDDVIRGNIRQEIGAHKNELTLNGTYEIQWKPIPQSESNGMDGINLKNYRYYLIEVPKDSQS